MFRVKFSINISEKNKNEKQLFFYHTNLQNYFAEYFSPFLPMIMIIIYTKTLNFLIMKMIKLYKIISNNINMYDPFSIYRFFLILHNLA